MCLPYRGRGCNRQASDPVEEKLRIKMRAAKRKMRGVNLQYVADRRVFFDDVAGIGEAKARRPRTRLWDRRGFCWGVGSEGGPL